MDQIPLVNEQIEDGRKVIQRLTENGIPITAAGWVKESDRWRWLLYLVTPLVGEDGDTKSAYRRIHTVLRALPQPPEIDPFQIKAIGPSERVGKAILDAQRQGRRWDGYGQQPRRVSVDGATGAGRAVEVTSRRCPETACEVSSRSPGGREVVSIRQASNRTTLAVPHPDRAERDHPRLTQWGGPGSMPSRRRLPAPRSTNHLPYEPPASRATSCRKSYGWHFLSTSSRRLPSSWQSARPCKYRPWSYRQRAASHLDSGRWHYEPNGRVVQTISYAGWRAWLGRRTHPDRRCIASRRSPSTPSTSTSAT
jgi:hypothetical protein